MSTETNVGGRPRENTSSEVNKAALCRRRAAIQLADFLIKDCSGPRIPGTTERDFINTLIRQWERASLNEQRTRVGAAVDMAQRSVEIDHQVSNGS